MRQSQSRSSLIVIIFYELYRFVFMFHGSIPCFGSDARYPFVIITSQIYKSNKTGLVSLAHLNTVDINFMKFVSFDFSSPLKSLRFITAMNSRFESCPSTEKSKNIFVSMYFVLRRKLLFLFWMWDVSSTYCFHRKLWIQHQ